MVETEIKGYNLSKDYKELFELIHKGNRIPAWIVYSDKYKEPIYDLVECKLQYMSDRWDIGVRGRSYSTLGRDLESFESLCKHLELRWIKPLHSKSECGSIHSADLNGKCFNCGEQVFDIEDEQI